MIRIFQIAQENWNSVQYFSQYLSLAAKICHEYLSIQNENMSLSFLSIIWELITLFRFGRVWYHLIENFRQLWIMGDRGTEDEQGLFFKNWFWLKLFNAKKCWTWSSESMWLTFSTNLTGQGFVEQTNWFLWFQSYFRGV